MAEERQETAGPRIEIASGRVMIDEHPEIWLRGFEPNGRVTVTAEAADDRGTRWRSETSYTLDAGGSLEIAPAPSGQDIITSMRPATGPEEPVPLFIKGTLRPVVVEFQATAENGDAARSSLELRVFDDAATLRVEVRDGPLQGTLFRPKGDGPFPVVIWIGGSDGWFTEPRPALLASHGIATFSVAYFGREPLPAALCEVPLEFFDRAVDRLSAEPTVDTGRMGLYGYSKGGELALLLASRNERIRAVAAYSPSSFVWQSPGPGQPKSSWAAGGTPLPFMPMHISAMMILKMIRGRPVTFRDAYEKGMEKHPDKAQEARIPVEKIKGPVLLVSGTEDAVWPSSRMADDVRASVTAAGGTVTHLDYDGAGHMTTLPGLPAPEVLDDLIFGGSSEITSRAVDDAWAKMVAFFMENL